VLALPGDVASRLSWKQPCSGQISGLLHRGAISLTHVFTLVSILFILTNKTCGDLNNS